MDLWIFQKSNEKGDDILTGGAGVDTFNFLKRSGKDIILDFVSGVDHIDLSAPDVRFFSKPTVSKNDADGAGFLNDLQIEFGRAQSFEKIILIDVASVDVADFFF